MRNEDTYEEERASGEACYEIQKQTNSGDR